MDPSLTTWISLRPEHVGLPLRPRRRTPGLRREEVAELIGIGVTWYTWLEQGRAIQVSAEVVEHLARVFRLSMDERAYLFQLAQRSLPPTRAESHEADTAAKLHALMKEAE